jgi:DNA-binding NarL/FixJ family response regulator
MTDHTDTLIHSGWLMPAAHVEPITEPADLTMFRRSLPLLSAWERTILDARAAGLSIPEIAAAHDLSETHIKKTMWGTLMILGLDKGVPQTRVTRAAYLLGRVDGERDA